LPDFSLRADIAVGNLSARKNAGLVRELTEFPNKSIDKFRKRLTARENGGIFIVTGLAYISALTAAGFCSARFGVF
jgi:hypothetical protein